MLRKSLVLVVLTIASMTLSACSGSGSTTDPGMGGDDMPMHVVADSLGR